MRCRQEGLVGRVGTERDSIQSIRAAAAATGPLPAASELQEHPSQRRCAEPVEQESEFVDGW